MGCLKNIFRAVILTLAIIGFMSLGGRELLTNVVQNWLYPSKDVMLEKAKKIGDFSNINEEFEIESASGVLGYNAVFAEHKASGQKMIVVDSGDKPILTQEDLMSADVEEKLQKLITNVKYQAVSVEYFTITKRGMLNSFGKSFPYITFEAKVKKLPIGDIKGIISVAKDSNGKEKLLISASEKDKYSQLIAEEFFKNVK